MWVEWVERVGRCHCPGFVLANLGYGQIATCGGRQPAEPTEPTTCQDDRRDGRGPGLRLWRLQVERDDVGGSLRERRIGASS